jgi:phosphatidylcholine synthase
MMRANPDISRPQQVSAWLVHFYTICGGIIAIFGLFEFARGNTNSGFLLILLSHLVDGTDGALARKVRVWDALPNFDGAMVDNVIDVFSYMWIPVYVMWHEELLPHDIWLVVPIIATMYAYGQVDMKTEDNFFLGFPSLWEVVVLYLYFLHPVGWVAVLMVVIPGILTFIPLKFLYPSKNKFLQKPTLLLVGVWVALWVVILLQEETSQLLVWISLYCPAYYFATSLLATYKFRDTASEDESLIPAQ